MGVYISRIWGEETPERTEPIFFLVKDIHDVITHAKFGDDRLRGSEVVAGQISAFPIDFAGRPYNTLTLPCERVIKAEVHRRRYCQLSWPMTVHFIILWASNSTERLKGLYTKNWLDRSNHFQLQLVTDGHRQAVCHSKYSRWRRVARGSPA